MTHHARRRERGLSPSSWPGLSQPSTSSTSPAIQDVDARHKAGHDEGRSTTLGISCLEAFRMTAVDGHLRARPRTATDLY
jgi:hypothetical protein